MQVIGIMFVLAYYLAVGIVWAIYFAGVGLFYLFAMIFNLIVMAFERRERAPKPATTKSVAKDAAATSAQMYQTGADAREELMRLSRR